MKQYELTYLISPELKTEEVEKLTLEISAFLQNEGGFIAKKENPKPKTLSYQIKKQGAAFQVGLEFCSTPEGLKTFEEKIRKDSRILRYLIIIKKPPKREQEEKPSFIKASASAFRASTDKPVDKSAEKSEGRTEKKVELKDIEEKLEEILKE